MRNRNYIVAYINCKHVMQIRLVLLSDIGISAGACEVL